MVLVIMMWTLIPAMSALQLITLSRKSVYPLYILNFFFCLFLISLKCVIYLLQTSLEFLKEIYDQLRISLLLHYHSCGKYLAVRLFHKSLYLKIHNSNTERPFYY